MSHNIRTSNDQKYFSGDSVYFKRLNERKWRGPGKVLGQDGQQILVKYGGNYVRVHPCRVSLARNTHVASSSPNNQAANQLAVNNHIPQHVPDVTYENITADDDNNNNIDTNANSNENITDDVSNDSADDDNNNNIDTNANGNENINNDNLDNNVEDNIDSDNNDINENNNSEENSENHIDSNTVTDIIDDQNNGNNNNQTVVNHIDNNSSNNNGIVAREVPGSFRMLLKRLQKMT